MEFKSQIATTREQSYKLLTLGLKPETADMSIPIKDNPNLYCSARPYNDWNGYWKHNRFVIPAWSLSRLLELIPKSIEQVNRPNADLDINSDGQCWFVTYVEFGYDVKHQEMKLDLFDSVISMISWLIANGHFYIEYLKGDIK